MCQKMEAFFLNTKKSCLSIATKKNLDFFFFKAIIELFLKHSTLNKQTTLKKQILNVYALKGKSN